MMNEFHLIHINEFHFGKIVPMNQISIMQVSVYSISQLRQHKAYILLKRGGMYRNDGECFSMPIKNII